MSKNVDNLLIKDLNLVKQYEALYESMNNNIDDVSKERLIAICNCAREVILNKSEIIKYILPYFLNGDEDDLKTEITECKSFNCENYKDGKCMLKKVRIVVVENELECEDATN